MRLPAAPMLVAAGSGFALAAALLVARPARAQFTLPAPTPAPVSTAPTTPPVGAVPNPQPIALQALDAQRFVVATREPRLMQSKDGSTANVLATVVTHYTMAGERLVPVEHVRVPQGWRLVVLPGE